jgi:hypothetical protein
METTRFEGIVPGFFRDVARRLLVEKSRFEKEFRAFSGKWLSTPSSLASACRCLGCGGGMGLVGVWETSGKWLAAYLWNKPGSREDLRVFSGKWFAAYSWKKPGSREEFLLFPGSGSPPTYGKKPVRGTSSGFFV